eukprot:scaffold121265_cov45-Phaeocystis_antarctica.AAC.1
MPGTGCTPTYGRPDPISAAPSAMRAFSGILRRATGPSAPPLIATSPEACVETPPHPHTPPPSREPLF